MQIEPNRRMPKMLTAKGYALHYSECDGGHAFLNWSQGMAIRSDIASDVCRFRQARAPDGS